MPSNSKTKPVVSPNGQTQPFPIAGIGASAGGLEVLETFLSKMPESSGIAFVIIQHLDPNHKGIMHELLQRVTKMPVHQVEDRMQVEPNSVYTIPPNKDMSILNGVLHLFEPTTPRGLRLPIDFFFRSLAEDQPQHSVGIILSGMGSDGTLGLRAIKEQGGLVVVQDPETAQFDSMPRNAIDAGLADIVAPAEDIPDKIVAYLQHVPVTARSQQPLEEKQKSGLEKIIILLRGQTGHDFSLYKKNTMYRRIERRMGIHQISRMATYIRYLQENPQEIELLFKEQLIGVTSFFRDPEEWKRLAETTIPALLKARPEGGAIRAWSAGCSTGEEAYSLAIAFKEVLDQQKTIKRYTLQIFATDLDRDAIDKARRGLYPEGIVADISDSRLRRYFVSEDGGYRIGREIRELVTFATQNLTMDPPFTKLDILLCRNLLIYLTPELQKHLIPLFHYSLNPGGTLFLGSAETVNTFTDLFTPVQAKSRLFLRRESVLHFDPVVFPATFNPVMPIPVKELSMPQPVANLQSLADQLLLQDYSPPAVLTTNQGDVLYINGRTGKYLEPAAGKANWNIFAMAREGLRFELTGAFQKAVSNNESLTVKGCKVGTNGGTQIVDLVITPLTKPAELVGLVMVVFRDVVTPPPAKKAKHMKPSEEVAAKIAEIEAERNREQVELQALREGMQGSQEELKSMNEELQSTNEELQSTNEELTTSKEELQSMNEELQTVNAEQTSKMNELGQVNNDMKNLLNSTEIITLFLDNDLHVQRFTTGANKIFKLLPGDVGRPLTDITSTLHYPELTDDAMEVLRSLTPLNKEVATNDGCWYLARTMPYRTLENIIDGVVLTFTNITSAKQQEKRLQESESMFHSLVEEMADLLICLSPEGKILEFNHTAEKLLNSKREEVIGKNYFALYEPNMDPEKMQEKLAAKAGNQLTTKLETSHGAHLSLKWSTSKLSGSQTGNFCFLIIGQELAKKM